MNSHIIIKYSNQECGNAFIGDLDNYGEYRIGPHTSSYLSPNVVDSSLGLSDHVHEVVITLRIINLDLPEPLARAIITDILRLLIYIHFNPDSQAMKDLKHS